MTQEECRGWDVNEVVFTPALWPTYQSLMRADFTLFDEYEFAGAGEPLFEGLWTEQETLHAGRVRL